MAFGDHRRVQNVIDYQGGTASNHLDNLRQNITRQNQGLENRFNVAADRGERDYGDIMSGYQSYMNPANNVKAQQVGYSPYTQNYGAYGGYENFANTGGYSAQDQQNIRARGLAPLRATYANAQSDLDRRNVIAGGNLGNYAAAKSKMARELGYGLSDQAQNIEAQLAQDIRSGKLSGLQGMTNIDQSRQQGGLQNAQQGLTAGMANARNSLEGDVFNSQRGAEALRGMTSLYGTAPGQAQLYGNQMLTSSNQTQNTEQLQMELMKAILTGTLGMAQVPGNTQAALGNISGILNLGSQVGGMINPFMPTGGNAGIPGLPGGTRVGANGGWGG